MADSIINDKSAADLCLTMGTAEFASEAIVKSLTEVETLFFRWVLVLVLGVFFSTDGARFANLALEIENADRPIMMPVGLLGKKGLRP